MSLIRTRDPVEVLLRSQGGFLRSFDLPTRIDTALRASADESGYDVRLEIPGTPPDDIVVETRDHVLEISIKGADDEPASWSRSIRVPNDADVALAEGEYVHGVLTVRIPKKAEAKPRQIEVRVA